MLIIYVPLVTFIPATTRHLHQQDLAFPEGWNALPEVAQAIKQIPSTLFNCLAMRFRNSMIMGKHQWLRKIEEPNQTASQVLLHSVNLMQALQTRTGSKLDFWIKIERPAAGRSFVYVRRYNFYSRGNFSLNLFDIRTFLGARRCSAVYSPRTPFAVHAKTGYIICSYFQAVGFISIEPLGGFNP